MSIHHGPDRGTTWRRLTCVALFTLVLTACDSDSGSPDASSIDGTWRGQLGAQTLTITLTEGNEAAGGKSVFGTGSVAAEGASLSFTLSGSYVHPLLSLDATFSVPPGTPPGGSISGQVNEARTVISATISGPGVNGRISLSPSD